jgi:hypothetical protein
MLPAFALMVCTGPVKISLAVSRDAKLTIAARAPFPLISDG